MRPMRQLACLFLISVLLASPLPAQSPPEGDLERLAWLAGCWSFARPDGETEEHWTAPRGGTMLGMSRTIRRGRTVEHEFVLIRFDSGRLAYEARPSGQPPAIFPLKALEADAVVFENPSHDFPQRIIYRRTADGVTARVEGTSDGKTRGIDFPFVRCRPER
jgi:hypothetical protein